MKDLTGLTIFFILFLFLILMGAHFWIGDFRYLIIDAFLFLIIFSIWILFKNREREVRSRKFILTLLLLSLILIFVDVVWSWQIYLIFPLYDVPAHFLGGFALSILISIYFKEEIKRISSLPGQDKIQRTKGDFIIISISSLFFVFWEFFEFLFDNFGREILGFGPLPSILGSTMRDLAFDFLGVMMFIFCHSFTRPPHR
jgi:hypothetical protein